MAPSLDSLITSPSRQTAAFISFFAPLLPKNKNLERWFSDVCARCFPCLDRNTNRVTSAVRRCFAFEDYFRERSIIWCIDFSSRQT